ncbi:MAG: hypothetical protein KC475_04735 [Cyanobacteria bacterium HKST-UBA03]|nr:hypothetical protein [Cyanobacteria bacterium HKST-UBA03]
MLGRFVKTRFRFAANLPGEVDESDLAEAQDAFEQQRGTRQYLSLVEEAALLDRITAGDGRAFDTLRRNFDGLVRFFVNRLKPTGTAPVLLEDAAEDAFHDAVVFFDRSRGNRLITYLFPTMWRRLNTVAGRKVNHHASLDKPLNGDGGEDGGATLLAMLASNREADHTLDHGADHSEGVGALISAKLSRLSFIERVLLQLRAGMTPDGHVVEMRHAAQLLGISRETLSKIQANATARLSQLTGIESSHRAKPRGADQYNLDRLTWRVAQRYADLVPPKSYEALEYRYGRGMEDAEAAAALKVGEAAFKGRRSRGLSYLEAAILRDQRYEPVGNQKLAEALVAEGLTNVTPGMAGLLPPHYKEVVAYRLVHGWRNKRVAKEMGLTEAQASGLFTSVLSQLRRGRFVEKGQLDEAVDDARLIEALKQRAAVTVADRSRLLGLSDEDRRALELRYVKGWELAEVGQALGWNFRTVHQHCKDAVAAMSDKTTTPPPQFTLAYQKLMPLIDSVRFEELPEAVRTTPGITKKRLWLLPLYLGSSKTTGQIAQGTPLSQTGVSGHCKAAMGLMCRAFDTLAQANPAPTSDAGIVRFIKQKGVVFNHLTVAHLDALTPKQKHQLQAYVMIHYPVSA